MKEAELLVVDVSGGNRGEYEWFVKDAESGVVVLNGEMSCDGMASEEAIMEAAGQGYQVIFMMVLDGNKDMGRYQNSNRPIITHKYDLIPGETRLFSERVES